MVGALQRWHVLLTRSVRRYGREWLLFVLLVGPNLFLFFVWTYWPLIYNVYLSFVQWDMISPYKVWVGLENYAVVFGDPKFGAILTNTLVFILGTVGGTLALGLPIALLLNQKLRGRNLARATVFAPVLVPGAAVAIVWVYIFDPRFGLLNALISPLGIPSPAWLTDVKWAMAAVIIVYIWKNLGYSVVIYLAGLQVIPRHLYEAAWVDGANAWQRFWHITLPGLSPIVFFLLVTGLLSSFQAFDILQAMTQGGPVRATTTLMYHLYDQAFIGFHPGRAGVLALVLFLFMFVLTVLQLQYIERKVH